MFCNKTKHSLRQKNENLFNSKNFLQLKELLMPFALRLFSRRDLPLNKRDWLSLNSMDRILIHQIQQQLLSHCETKRQVWLSIFLKNLKSTWIISLVMLRYFLCILNSFSASLLLFQSSALAHLLEYRIVFKFSFVNNALH